MKCRRVRGVRFLRALRLRQTSEDTINEQRYRQDGEHRRGAGAQRARVAERRCAG